MLSLTQAELKLNHFITSEPPCLPAPRESKLVRRTPLHNIFTKSMAGGADGAPPPPLIPLLRVRQFGAGLEGVDVEAANAAGVPVANIPAGAFAAPSNSARAFCDEERVVPVW